MNLVQPNEPSLLTTADPAPVDTVNLESQSPLLLLCEHAGQAVPARLGDLGISDEILNSHRGWDIGAEAVARLLAEHTGAPLIMQRYSRLVIDANRPPHSPAAFPTVSDGAEIAGNLDITQAERDARVASIFEPMDRTIADAFASAPRLAAFSIHSFAPRIGDTNRPWHAGFLTRKSHATAETLMMSIARRAPELTLALNEPYQIGDASDWFIPQHAEARDLPHSLIEIRNDQLQTGDGVARWAELLADAITDLLEALP